MARPAPTVKGGNRLLVLLHGHGDEPGRLLDHLDTIDPGRRFTSVAPRGPVAAADDTPSWFDDETDGATLVAAVHERIEWAAGSTGLEASEVVVLGYSQGAAAALAVAASGSVPLAGVVAVAGWLPNLAGLALEPATGLAVLAVHGAGDDVVPAPAGRSAARFLERSGCAVDWHEVATGHLLDATLLAPVAGWLAAR